jgi:cytochrome c-type biogenesis protein CcmF
MTPELGHFALALALALAMAQTFFGLMGGWKRQERWMEAAHSAVMGQTVFVAIAISLLSHAFMTNDFSVAYVANNSNSALPALFKFSALWGAHEGSLVLWIFILSLWSVAVSLFSKSLPETFRARVLGILGLVSVGFLAFTLGTSNPFLRLIPAAADGADLNPLLQDFALAVHPPMLYTGYVGTAVAFAFACAAMFEGRLDATWARWTRPWTTVAWLFLTVGIALGSWWAYYELGWGGWWFWDPVENASFMPWLVCTALIHSLAVTEKRGLFKSWTLLLAIFAFSLSLLGTFLVRSGVLVSVHSFASDPSRGIFILGLLTFFIIGSLVLFAWRAPLLQSTAGFGLFSREAFLLLNNVLLVVSAALILLGTLWPLFMDAFSLGKISVGPPYFNAVFLVPGLPLVVAIGIGMHATWKHSRLAPKPVVFGAIAAVAAVLALGFMVWLSHYTVLAAIGFMAGVFVIGASLYEPWQRWRGGHSLPAAVLGMTIAHIGVGMFTIGVTGVESSKIERDIALGVGDSAEVAGYVFKLESLKPVQGPNYNATEGEVTVRHDGDLVATLHPQKRNYWVRTMPMTEAGISVGPGRDLFAALGEDLGGGRWSVRVQYKPLIRYIWLGALVMALGGLLATADRRYRRKRPDEVAVASNSAHAEG